jgi:hypothetical protein
MVSEHQLQVSCGNDDDNEALDQRHETAFLKAMEAALNRLDIDEQEILRTAVQADLKRDKDDQSCRRLKP